MLPADFKPKFNFVLSESASAIRRAAAGKEAWLRPKPFETVNLLATNRCDVQIANAPNDGNLTGVTRGAQKETEKKVGPWS